MESEKRKTRHITSFQIIIAGFFLVILVGSLLLMLPFATQEGKSTGFLEALFTATYWSTFGQIIILLLIQIGGMGVVTIAVAVATASGRKIGLMQRSTMQEAISAPQLGGIVRMTQFILKTSILIEVIGAVLLSSVFCKEYGIGKGIWYAIFHSVSAFCNAGFDLNGIEAPFSSLVNYSVQPVVNLTVILLIIIGGIGFITWADIEKNKWHFKKYRMQSKVILTVTACLIVIPAVYFFFCEFSEFSMEKRIWASIFQSVTPRTAGFNTVDLTMISETGQMVIIILMLIGGSPGSTAGGMKTTTFAVLCASAKAVFQKKESAHFFGRRVPNDAVRTAATIFLMYIVLFLSGGMIISYREGLPLIQTLFETGSAIGTVGLSLGITPELGDMSHLILIGLMFFGRVGGLTLIFAALSENKINNSMLPLEKITVG